LRRQFVINLLGIGQRKPGLMALGMGTLMPLMVRPLFMSYSLELSFRFYKIMAFGPKTKGNGELPLPQMKCYAF
jgi:hypothetical protein